MPRLAPHSSSERRGGGGSEDAGRTRTGQRPGGRRGVGRAVVEVSNQRRVPKQLPSEVDLPLSWTLGSKINITQGERLAAVSDGHRPISSGDCMTLDESCQREKNTVDDGDDGGDANPVCDRILGERATRG